VPEPADGETAAGAVPEEEIGEWKPVVLVEQVVLVEHTELVDSVVLVVLVELVELVVLVELGAEVVAVAAEYHPPKQHSVYCGQRSPEHTHLWEKMEKMYANKYNGYDQN
jgi:hypothetical protein